MPFGTKPVLNPASQWAARVAALTTEPVHSYRVISTRPSGRTTRATRRVGLRSRRPSRTMMLSGIPDSPMSKKSAFTPATAPLRRTIDETVSSGLIRRLWASATSRRTAGLPRSSTSW
jgi:hypothetical protein